MLCIARSHVRLQLPSQSINARDVKKSLETDLPMVFRHEFTVWAGRNVPPLAAVIRVASIAFTTKSSIPLTPDCSLCLSSGSDDLYVLDMEATETC